MFTDETDPEFQKILKGISVMKHKHTGVTIDRNYRESGTFQWVREALVNIIQAPAGNSKLSAWFDVESIAYKQGVARMMIADNGCGMTAEELCSYMGTYGEGSKAIGGIHDNFGIGSKTSLLPWNREGVVIISWTESDDAHMIQIQWGQDEQEYGLRHFAADGPTGLEITDSPTLGFDRKYNINWAEVRQAFIDGVRDKDASAALKQHGTIIVLLGMEPKQHTVFGNPKKPQEGKMYGLRKYLNQRFWQFNGITVHVREWRQGIDRGTWFKSESMLDRSESVNWTSAIAHGAEAFVHYLDSMRRGDASKNVGKIATSGTVTLPDRTLVNWYLWEGERSAASERFFFKRGFIAIYYEGELYDVTEHLSHYRQFGIAEAKVRENLTMIIHPPKADDGKDVYGIYPRGDRNALLIRDVDGEDGVKLPINEWAGGFCARMPEAIRAALQACYDGAKDEPDNEWALSLWSRLGSRFIVNRRVSNATPDDDVHPDAVGGRGDRGNGTGGHGGGHGPGFGNGTGGTGTRPRVPGHRSGDDKTIAKIGGLPTYRWQTAENFGDSKFIATWMAHDPDHPRGIVLLNFSHPVIQDIVCWWRNKVPDHYAEEVAKVIQEVYGTVLCCAIGHTEQLACMYPREVISKELRGDAALTLKMLGLISEDALIADRLRKFGTKTEEVGTSDAKEGVTVNVTVNTKTVKSKSKKKRTTTTK